MRKTFVLFLGGIICGIGAICLLSWYIMRGAEQVVFTENVVYGDPSAAEGVTVTTHSYFNDYLFWDTVYTVGKDPVAQTEYRRFVEGEVKAKGPTPNIPNPYTYVRFFDTIEDDSWQLMSDDDINIDSCGDINILKSAYKKLVEDTKAGETARRTVSLNDYYEYYPLGVTLSNLDTMEIGQNIEGLYEAYSNFFKIPLLDESTYEIWVGKDADGEVVDMGGEYTGSDNFYWDITSICTDTDFYFAFSPCSENGMPVDTSLIPGGYGIYRQPYSVGEKNRIEADASQLEMVFPLEEGFFSNSYLNTNAAGQLVILTSGERASYLQIVDPDTMELIQKLELTRPEGTDGVSIVRYTEEFMLLYCGNYYYMLIDWNEDRGYEEQFVIQVGEEDMLFYDRYNTPAQDDMEWNGERLYYVCYKMKMHGLEAIPGFQLAVYDKTGLLYNGKYFSSLQTGQERAGHFYSYRENCMPRGDVPIDVEVH